MGDIVIISLVGFFCLMAGLFLLFFIFNTISSSKWLKTLFYISSITFLHLLFVNILFIYYCSVVVSGGCGMAGFYFYTTIPLFVIFSIFSLTYYCFYRKVKNYKIYLFLAIVYFLLVLLLLWSLTFVEISDFLILGSVLSMIFIFGILGFRCFKFFWNKEDGLKIKNSYSVYLFKAINYIWGCILSYVMGFLFFAAAGKFLIYNNFELFCLGICIFIGLFCIFGFLSFKNFRLFTIERKNMKLNNEYKPFWCVELKITSWTISLGILLHTLKKYFLPRFDIDFYRLFGYNHENIIYIIGVIWISLGIPLCFSGIIRVKEEFYKGDMTNPGIFKYIQYPVYSAFYIFFFPGIIFMSDSIIGLAMPFIFYIFFRKYIVIEEKYLEEKYGEKYLKYKKETGRIIPKII